MMGVFQDMVLTQQGLNLLENAQTGTALEFTRIAVGDGSLTSQDPTQLAQLINQTMSLNISSVGVGGSGVARLNTILSNTGLEANFYWRELGIFAQDPQLGEILYAYNNSGREILVPAASTGAFTAPLNIEVFISNAVNVTAQLDPSLIYVPLTGASMVGPLVLSGDPTQNLGAATKQYVDTHLPSEATTTQVGLVEVSVAPSGVPVAVSTTDPAYQAVSEGSYVIPGEGLTSTSQANRQSLAVVFSAETPAAETVGTTGVVGTSSSVARAGHVHPMPESYPPSAHESTHLTGGSDPIPVATETTDGLFSSTDKTKLDGITTGATNTPLSNATPTAETEGAAGSAGTGINAAREDHIHPMPSSYTPSVHESTHLTGGSDPIPLATETTDGLFSGNNKTKLDGIADGATKVTQASDIGAETPVCAQDKADAAQAAAQSYADTKVADLVNSAPATLDTLKKLADALGDDPNFATTMANALATKAAASDLAAHVADDMKHIAYATMTNSGNAYSVTVPNLTTLTDGLQIRVKFNVASTGAITVNPNSLGAKNVVDYFGNVVTNIRANLIANLCYESTSGNFILQGKGGGGNATAAQLLSGATATVDSGPITGTMPNNGAVILTPGTTNQAIVAGYHNGSGYVKGDANLVTGNIKAGASIFGVAGKSSVVDTSDANAIASQILSGLYAYVNGVKLTGTIPSKTAQTYTPGTSTQTISAGQYLSGAQTIAGDANLIAANIVSGKSIFGIAGTALQVPITGLTPGSNIIFSGYTSSVTITRLSGTVTLGGYCEDNSTWWSGGTMSGYSISVTKNGVNVGSLTTVNMANQVNGGPSAQLLSSLNVTISPGDTLAFATGGRTMRLFISVGNSIVGTI